MPFLVVTPFDALPQLPWRLLPRVPSGGTPQCLRRSDRRGADTKKRPGAVLFSGTTQSIDTASTVLVLPVRQLLVFRCCARKRPPTPAEIQWPRTS